MLTMNAKLAIFFLHWNKILSRGAVLLSASLQKNNTLQIFDFSFNNIGVANNHESAIALSQAFSNNNSLIHLDLSGVNFDMKDIEFISKVARESQHADEGLIQNHSILGIHMIGNKGTIDALGFVKPVEA